MISIGNNKIIKTDLKPLKNDDKDTELSSPVNSYQDWLLPISPETVNCKLSAPIIIPPQYLPNPSPPRKNPELSSHPGISPLIKPKNSKLICLIPMKSGPRKGQPCNRTCVKNSDICSYHLRQLKN